jgi:uncharacterized protein YdhG (YjbR/CyaY superfamily)
MKKKASRPRNSLKSKASQNAVEAYVAAVREPARSTLNKLRATIRSVVPEGAEEVISYGIPAFKANRVLVWYAAFADHCSLFPTASVVAKFKEELKGYQLSKGTIHFPIGGPLPAALLKKMVKERLAEVEGKRK